MQTTWQISTLDRRPQHDGFADVVLTAHWRCTGTQIVDGKTYTGTVYSTCSFPAPTGESFTPYEQLTEAQVLAWVWANGVDKDATEAAVQAQIDAQVTPAVVSGTPWGQA